VGKYLRAGHRFSWHEGNMDSVEILKDKEMTFTL